MRAAIHDASARQDPGGPSPVLGRGGDRNNRPRNPGTAELEDAIAGLVGRSTKELRLAWHKLHRTGPPLGLSRDLMIRMFANKLQERVHGGPSLALRRRLQSLAGGLTLHIWTSHDVPWLASDDDLPRHPEWQSGR
jgi:hypothetical protein